MQEIIELNLYVGRFTFNLDEIANMPMLIGSSSPYAS
jgi:hypothetical protein